MMTTTPIRRRRERGAALLEAAVTVPIILLISVGIFEFGRAYQTWQVLTNAAREGARLAVIAGSTDADVTGRVRGYMTAGQLPNASTAVVTINRGVALTASDTGSRITINYPFQFMVLNPVVRLVSPSATTGAPITMQARAIMRNEI
jgi:Flp pilus assembly protein TadG